MFRIEQKVRSTTWLVLHYVITVGILFPALFGIAAVLLLVSPELMAQEAISMDDRWYIMIIGYGATLIGYVVGAWQGSAYINKRAIVSDRMKVVRYSTIVLALFYSILFILDLLFPIPAEDRLFESVAIDMTFTLVSEIVSLAIFYLLGRRFFARA